MSRYSVLAVDCAKESLLFGLIGVPAAYALLFIINNRNFTSYYDYYGFVLLLEACGLMLLGGAMEFTSSGGIRKILSVVSGGRIGVDSASAKSLSSGAEIYTLTGVILFCASLATAYLISV